MIASSLSLSHLDPRRRASAVFCVGWIHDGRWRGERDFFTYKYPYYSVCMSGHCARVNLVDFGVLHGVGICWPCFGCAQVKVTFRRKIQEIKFGVREREGGGGREDMMMMVMGIVLWCGGVGLCRVSCWVLEEYYYCYCPRPRPLPSPLRPPPSSPFCTNFSSCHEAKRTFFFFFFPSAEIWTVQK